MRVHACGNLTVELIRAQRFDVAQRPDALCEQHERLGRIDATTRDDCQHPIDRVQLSPEALASDPWATPTCRVHEANAPMRVDSTEPIDAPIEIEPERITPVIGSPALSGLGVAMIVPGTLLDVVA